MIRMTDLLNFIVEEIGLFIFLNPVAENFNRKAKRQCEGNRFPD